MRGLLLVTATLVLLLAASAPAQEAARRDCGIVTITSVESVAITATSATCATARRVGRRWGRRDRCRDGRCRLGAWACKPVRRGAQSRCARPRHPRQVVELRRLIVIID